MVMTREGFLTKATVPAVLTNQHDTRAKNGSGSFFLRGRHHTYHLGPSHPSCPQPTPLALGSSWFAIVICRGRFGQAAHLTFLKQDVLELTTITESMHKHKPSFDDSCRLFVVRKRIRADDKHGRKARAQPLWGSISNFCIDITRTTDAPGLEFEGVRLRLHGGYFNECFIES